MPRLLALALVLLLAACGGTMQTVKLVNQTPRKIVEVYIYKMGAKDPGKSRGTVAANGTMVLKLPMGNMEIRVVSERERVDDHTYDTREASTAFELKKKPLELVFHDSNQPAPPAGQTNVIGVAFRVSSDEGKKPTPEDDVQVTPGAEPTPEPQTEP